MLWYKVSMKTALLYAREREIIDESQTYTGPDGELCSVVEFANGSKIAVASRHETEKDWNNIYEDLREPKFYIYK